MIIATTADISAKIISEIELGPLLAIEGEQLKESYGIDHDMFLTDGIFLQPKITLQAGGFSVVHLNEDKYYDEVVAAFENRAKTITFYFPLRLISKKRQMFSIVFSQIN